MKWAFRIATVAGIEVRLHATFLLLLGLYVWMYFLSGGWDEAGLGVSFMLLLFLCVLLHEFGHAFAARAFGIRTPDITLFPIGGVARLEKLPGSPWEELVIAVAGPAVNVVIVLLLWPLAGGITSWADVFDVRLHSGGLALNLLKLNCILIAFNLIPAFPMDGGRVLRALLATRMRQSLATLVAARVGQGIAVVFVALALIGSANLLMILIGFVVFVGAQQELTYARMRESARLHRLEDVLDRECATLPETLPLGAVAERLVTHGSETIAVVDTNRRFCGFIERDALLDAAGRLDPETPVGSLVRPLDPLAWDTPLESALEIMQRLRQPVLPVLDPDGDFAGVVEIEALVGLAQK